MFYAAMYALKGREQRRAATALQQLTGVDLGGVPSGKFYCEFALFACCCSSLPWTNAKRHLRMRDKEVG